MTQGSQRSTVARDGRSQDQTTRTGAAAAARRLASAGRRGAARAPRDAVAVQQALGDAAGGHAAYGVGAGEEQHRQRLLRPGPAERLHHLRQVVQEAEAGAHAGEERAPEQPEAAVAQALPQRLLRQAARARAGALGVGCFADADALQRAGRRRAPSVPRPLRQRRRRGAQLRWLTRARRPGRLAHPIPVGASVRPRPAVQRAAARRSVRRALAAGVLACSATRTVIEEEVLELLTMNTLMNTRLQLQCHGAQTLESCGLYDTHTKNSPGT